MVMDVYACACLGQAGGKCQQAATDPTMGSAIAEALSASYAVIVVCYAMMDGTSMLLMLISGLPTVLNKR